MLLHTTLNSWIRLARHVSPKGAIRSILLLYDNAWTYTAAAMQAEFEELHWIALNYPPYSPDLSPLDSFV